ncbi:MAG: hypothetical protein FWH36_08890 [Lentimicrobiaceae bacterium]|nr:hypothetical protein [Lentimicrobiaceae bacterium]
MNSKNHNTSIKKTPHRHCEGDSPKQSIEKQHAELRSSVRNDASRKGIIGKLVLAWACVLVFVIASCDNKTIECVEENISEDVNKELIKDSALYEEINKFVTSLREKEFEDDFVLIVQFDSIIWHKDKNNYLEIRMEIAPCFSDTCGVLGGYIPDLDVFIAIKDKKNIGKSYYNALFLDKKTVQSFYCNENDIEKEYELFFKNEATVGYSFIVTENELYNDGISVIKTIE